MSRMPKPNEELTGKVCVCTTGRVGIVTGVEIKDLPASIEDAARQNQDRQERGLDPYPFEWVPAGYKDHHDGGQIAMDGRGYLTKEIWHGLGIDGLGAWGSSDPVILAESADEFRIRIKERFGGRLIRPCS